MSVWSEVMLKYQVVCHGCKKQGREFRGEFQTPETVCIESAKCHTWNFIECHCYMHTRPIKHLQIRGQ